MTKSSVSQDESLLLPPESREPCRKPAASAGEVSVFCSCCCTSPRDCRAEGRPLRPGPGLGRKEVCRLPPPTPRDRCLALAVTHWWGGQVRGGAAAGAAAGARAGVRGHRHGRGCRGQGRAVRTLSLAWWTPDPKRGTQGQRHRASRHPPNLLHPSTEPTVTPGCRRRGARTPNLPGRGHSPRDSHFFTEALASRKG